MAILTGLLKSSLSAEALADSGIELPETPEQQVSRENREWKARQIAEGIEERRRLQAAKDAAEAQKSAKIAARLAAIEALGIPDYEEAKSLLPYLERMYEGDALASPLLSPGTRSEARYWGWTRSIAPPSLPSVSPLAAATPASPDEPSDLL